MIDDPASDDEFMFASDFYPRKFGVSAPAAEAFARRISQLSRRQLGGNPEAGVAGCCGAISGASA